MAVATSGVLLAVGVLAATASTPGRSSVLRQLERPATHGGVRVASGGLKAVLRGQRYRLALGLMPNRAAVRNRLSVQLSDHGRPLDGARVTVTFSMPVMNMWGALTTRLVPTGNGTYTTSLPVLGMAGSWQLRLNADAPGGVSISRTLNDRMGA